MDPINNEHFLLPVEQILSPESSPPGCGDKAEGPDSVASSSAELEQISEVLFTSTGLQGLSLEPSQKYTKPVSLPSDTIPIPRYALIPHAVQNVDLKEGEGAGMAPDNLLCVVATTFRRVTHVPDLPNELILDILSYLYWRNIVCCRLLCRWIRDAVDRSVEYQYRIALGLSSSEDRPWAGPLATADRLRLLDAQQQAWRSLTHYKAVTFTVPFSSSLSLTYDFSGGMFGIGTVAHSELYRIRLPAARGVEDKLELEWLHVQLGFELTDFAMDIEQDLLIIIELQGDRQSIRFHFWTLSTHIPHPAASSLTLEHPLKSPMQDDFRVQIVGSHIGVIFPSSKFCEGGQLIIYSWTTGHTRAYVDASPVDRLRSFAFISPYVFVIPWNNILGLYSFDPESTIDPAPELTPIISFKLPDGCRPNHYFQCRATPCRQSDRRHLKSNAIGSSSSVPFSVDTEDGIIAFWLKPGLLGPMFVVHRSKLLSYLNRWDGPKRVKTIDWHAWGPKHTRWFEGSSNEYWLNSVSGHRLVMLEPTVENGARKFIVILDFNPALVSKALTRSVANDFVTARSLCGREFFKAPVESGLPYLEARTGDSFICSGAMLDDHRILLIQDMGGRFGGVTLLLP